MTIILQLLYITSVLLLFNIIYSKIFVIFIKKSFHSFNEYIFTYLRKV